MPQRKTLDCMGGEDKGIYTVKTCYRILSDVSGVDQQLARLDSDMESLSASKNQDFAWQACVNLLPMADLL